MAKNLWDQEKKLDEIGQQGVWVEYDDGVSFLLGSTETPLYKKTFSAVYERERTKYKNRDIPDDVAEAAFNEVYANAIVLDWKGMVDESGNPMDYTRENVMKVLSGLRRVRVFIVQFSNERKNFANALEDDARKNSSTASSGASTGEAVH